MARDAPAGTESADMIDEARRTTRVRLSDAYRTALATGALRHYGGFALAGVCALATDATVLLILTHVAGVSPLLARPAGISLAMIVSWLINRTVSFAATTPPNLREFARFAAVAWTAQAVNYAIFATVLLLRPGTEPLVALILACCIAMFVSYAGFRFGVFHKH